MLTPLHGLAKLPDQPGPRQGHPEAPLQLDRRVPFYPQGPGQIGRGGSVAEQSEAEEPLCQGKVRAGEGGSRQVGKCPPAPEAEISSPRRPSPLRMGGNPDSSAERARDPPRPAHPSELLVTPGLAEIAPHSPRSRLSRSPAWRDHPALETASQRETWLFHLPARSPGAIGRQAILRGSQGRSVPQSGYRADTCHTSRDHGGRGRKRIRSRGYWVLSPLHR